MPKNLKSLFCLSTVIIFTLTTFLPSVAFSDIRVASFNIQGWGWNNGKSNEKVAAIIERFDIIAVQEVMDPHEPARMVQRLEQLTGEPWQEMTSHLIGRSTYREAYSFIWRKSAVEYLDGAVVYLDNRDVFAREPFSARFRSRNTGTTFAISNIHVLYGSSISDRLPEIEALASYWDWLDEVYPDTPRIIAGDFNLDPNHQGWGPLLSRGAIPAITQGATTLSPTDGRYANLYDNFWLTPGGLDVQQVGVFRFPYKLAISHERARDVVSDHAPVYLALGNARVDTTPYDGAVMNLPYQPSCINLNSASMRELMELPHIGEARALEVKAGRPWHSASELSSIRGISDVRAQEIGAYSGLCQ